MKRIEPGRLLSQPWFYATAGAILVWIVIPVLRRSVDVTPVTSGLYA